MPVIKEYGDAKVGTPGAIKQPQYTADQLGAAEGAALVQAGQAVQGAARTVAKRIDQENTSEITTKVTEANANLAVDLQNVIRTAKPGDKKAFEDYNKRVEETLAKIGEEASTEGARSFYAEASTRIKGQLYKTSMDGQAELAGLAAVNHYESTLNNLSAATMAAPDSVQLQRDLHKQAVENLVLNEQLPRSKAEELLQRGDTALVTANIRGWAELNPTYAKQKLKSGEFDKELGAEGKLRLDGEIDQAIRAKEIDAERRRAAQERALKESQRVTQNDLLQGLVDKKLTTQDIMRSNLDAFGSGSKEQFLQLMKAANQPEERLKTDPATMISLFNRIHLPDGDPNKITDENYLNQFAGNGVSFPDLNRLRDEFQGKGTAAGQVETDLKRQLFEIAKGKLTKTNPMVGFRDPVGDENLQRYMGYFFDEYKKQRAAGISPQELLTPGNKNYLGAQIEQYVRTPQQILRDAVRRKPSPGSTLAGPQVSGTEAAGASTPTYRAPQAPAPLPRQPGETPDAYLKRSKGGQ